MKTEKCLSCGAPLVKYRNSPAGKLQHPGIALGVINQHLPGPPTWIPISKERIVSALGCCDWAARCGSDSQPGRAGFGRQ